MSEDTGGGDGCHGEPMRENAHERFADVESSPSIKKESAGRSDRRTKAREGALRNLGPGLCPGNRDQRHSLQPRRRLPQGIADLRLLRQPPSRLQICDDLLSPGQSPGLRLRSAPSRVRSRTRKRHVYPSIFKWPGCALTFRRKDLDPWFSTPRSASPTPPSPSPRHAAPRLPRPATGSFRLPVFAAPRRPAPPPSARRRRSRGRSGRR